MSDDNSWGDPLEDIGDLNDLIRYLEHEKERIIKCVEMAVEERNFSEVKAYNKTLGKVSARLNVLKNLRDPGFDELASHYRMMVFLEEQKKKYANNPALAEHYTLELKEINEALDKLENTRHHLIDTQHIDDAICMLVEGSIESFTLHLNKSAGMAFDFVLKGELVEIGFSYKKGELPSLKKKRFRKIGFSKVDGSNRFVYGINVGNFKDAQKIKHLLAVVVFDIFDRTWFDNPAELEIHFKTRAEPE